jgi:hypothetical protein
LRSDKVNRHLSSLGLRSLPWRRFCDGSLAVEKSSGFHCGRHLFAAVFPERGGYAAIVLAFGHRQAVFEFRNSRNFFPPGMVVTERHDGAVVAHQRPDDVSVSAAVFGVIDARAGRLLESELALIAIKEGSNYSVRIGAIRRRVDVRVVDRSIRSAVCCGCDKLADLIPQMLCGEAAGWHHIDDLAVMLLE